VRIQACCILITVALALVGCTHRNNQRVGEAARKAEQGSEKVARELGKVGAKAAVVAGKAARKASEQIKQSSRDAHEGWDEEKQKEREKH
jgi:hypothetical protein